MPAGSPKQLGLPFEGEEQTKKSDAPHSEVFAASKQVMGSVARRLQPVDKQSTLEQFFIELQKEFDTRKGERPDLLLHMRRFIGRKAVTLHDDSWHYERADPSDRMFLMDEFIRKCTIEFSRVTKYIRENLHDELHQVTTPMEREMIVQKALRALGFNL